MDASCTSLLESLSKSFKVNFYCQFVLFVNYISTNLNFCIINFFFLYILSTHVLTEDTIKREVRDGKLYSRRILSKTNPVPKWGERFYKNTPVKILEDSVLDLKKKTLTTFTRNIGFKKIMVSGTERDRESVRLAE